MVIPFSILILSLLATFVQCIPVPVLESPVSVDDILRRFNVSRENIESFRQNLVGNSAATTVSSQQHHRMNSTDGPTLESIFFPNPANNSRQLQDHQSEFAFSAQQAIRNRYIPVARLNYCLTNTFSCSFK